MRKQVERGQAPKDITRVDNADTNIPKSEDEVHFGDKIALKRNGSWKHAPPGDPDTFLTNDQKDWLRQNDFNVPGESGSDDG